jgi:hypothetical protein
MAVLFPTTRCQMMAELVHNRPLTCCCTGQRQNENNKTGGDDGAKRDQRKQTGLPNFGCGQMVIRAIFGYDNRTLIVTDGAANGTIIVLLRTRKATMYRRYDTFDCDGSQTSDPGRPTTR